MLDPQRTQMSLGQGLAEFESVFVLKLLLRLLMMAEAGIPSCKYLEEAQMEIGTRKMLVP